MNRFQDGPQSSLFKPLPFKGNVAFAQLSAASVSAEMAAASVHAAHGDCVGWGVPFQVSDPLVLAPDGQEVQVNFEPFQARQLIFMHSSDVRSSQPNTSGFISPTRGRGQLGEHAANYAILYADGSEQSIPIRRRHQIGPFTRGWGENCFEAVAMHKPHPVRASHEQLINGWGRSQTRNETGDNPPWTNWLWSWENPNPHKAIAGLRFEPLCGAIVVSAVTAGNASSLPLRWRTRCKALLTLPAGEVSNRTWTKMVCWHRFRSTSAR